MFKKRIVFLTVLMAIFLVSSSSWAEERGPIVANNILGGAGAGTVVGLSAGLWAYGEEHQTDPKVLLTSSVYGFLTGAVVGTGIGFYEISTGSRGTGFTVSDYVMGGTGLGALLGMVVAIIPFTDDGQWENFTIGAGIGGLVGGAFGLGFAILDISSRSAQGDVLLSGQVGVYPEVKVPLDHPTEETTKHGEPLLSCRLVKLTF